MPVLKLMLSFKINEILNPEYVRENIEKTINKECDVDGSLVRLVDCEIVKKEPAKDYSRLFGVSKIDPTRLYISNIGLVKYKIKQRPGDYAIIYLKYADRIESRTIHVREDGLMIPGDCIACNIRNICA
jgi:hypothetical protein